MMAIIMGLVVCEAGEGRGGENTGKGAGKQRNSSGRSKRGFTLSVEQGCGQKVCGAVGGWWGGR